MLTGCFVIPTVANTLILSKMEEMKNCYFCGAKAPQAKKFKGVWKMVCNGCGGEIAHPDYESVVDMWNYNVTAGVEDE